MQKLSNTEIEKLVKEVTKKLDIFISVEIHEECNDIEGYLKGPSGLPIPWCDNLEVLTNTPISQLKDTLIASFKWSVEECSPDIVEDLIEHFFTVYPTGDISKMLMSDKLFIKDKLDNFSELDFFKIISEICEKGDTNGGN